VELELVEKLPLLEWLANNYKSFGRYQTSKRNSPYLLAQFGFIVLSEKSASYM